MNVSLAACLLSFAFPPIAFAQQVWSVDPAGTGSFSTIQEAIDAVAPGDLILVESGTYGGFRIAGKPIQVRAAAGAEVVVTGVASIGGMKDGAAAVLEGLQFVADTQSKDRIEIRAADGWIWVADTTVERDCAGATASSGAIGVLRDSTDPDGSTGGVVLVHIAASVQNCLSFLPFGGTGICFSVTDANVHVFDSELHANQSAAALQFLPAAPKLEPIVPVARFSNCLLAGGDGFEVDDCFQSVNGGPAAALSGLGGISQLVTRSSQLVGGNGTVNSCGTVGTDGESVVLGFGGVWTDLGGGSLEVTGPLQVHADTPFTWQFQGSPSAAFGLVVSLGAGLIEFPSALEPILVGEPFLRLHLGALDEKGQADVSLLVPGTLLSGEYLAVYAQSYQVDPIAGLIPGTPMPVAVLDPSAR